MLRISNQIAKSVIIIIFVFLFQAPNISFAQNEPSKEGIELKPSRLNYQLSPGDKSGDKLTIKNLGTLSVNIKFYLEPYGLEGEQYEQKFEKLPGWKTAEEWISFDKDEIELNPDEEKTVLININVPGNAEVGGHYGAIFAETTPKDSQTESIKTSKRVGALVYFEIGGELTKNLSVESYSSKWWSKNNTLEYNLRIKNSGNTHALTNTTLYAKRFGFGSWSVEKKANIFPGTIRKIDMNISDLSPGLYRVRAKVSADGLQEETGTRWVLVASVWQIALAALLLIAITTLIVNKLKNKKTPAKDRKQQLETRI